MPVTKSDLIETLSIQAKLPKGKAEMVVNVMFDSMIEALQRDERIEIRGFGSFEVRNYKAYEGRNPRTGETVHVKPKKLPFFKVGKELRERINRDAVESAPPPAPAVAPPAFHPPVEPPLPAQPGIAHESAAPASEAPAAPPAAAPGDGQNFGQAPAAPAPDTSAQPATTQEPAAAPSPTSTDSGGFTPPSFS